MNLLLSKFDYSIIQLRKPDPVCLKPRRRRKEAQEKSFAHKLFIKSYNHQPPLSTLITLKRLKPPMVRLNVLLPRTADLNAALSSPTLESPLRNTGRVILVANIRVEARVVARVIIEATLMQVLALRLALSRQTRHIRDIRGRLSTDVRVPAAASAGGSSLLLFGGGGTADVAISVGAREVTLAAEGLGVLFLSVAVFAEAADGHRWELGCAGGVVGALSGCCAAGGVDASVLRESAALGGGCGG